VRKTEANYSAGTGALDQLNKAAKKMKNHGRLLVSGLAEAKKKWGRDIDEIHKKKKRINLGERTRQMWLREGRKRLGLDRGVEINEKQKGT